ncbi:MAG: antirestriction protein ArdA [Vulcanococcus sp.]
MTDTATRAPQIVTGCPDRGIYVACLASYNNGTLYGAWIDLEDGIEYDELREAIADVISHSPTPGAEEYAIHDYCGLPKWLMSSEWPDLDQLCEYCGNLADLAADGQRQEAYELACENQYQLLSIDDALDSYYGTYSEPAEFAYDYYEQQGTLDEVPEELRHRIDWEGVWHDMDCNGWAALKTADGDYAIFS